MCIGKAFARFGHGVTPLLIVQQTFDHPYQFCCVSHPDCGARFDCAACRILEIERMRTDNHCTADSARFQQVLAAERQQAAADERNIAGGVIREHLAHRIADDDTGVRFNRPVFAAALKCIPALFHQ